ALVAQIKIAHAGDGHGRTPVICLEDRPDQGGRAGTAYCPARPALTQTGAAFRTTCRSRALSPTLTLYGYWRSSAVYRVRIALNLKALDYHYKPLHLLRDGGEQHGADYRALNPQQLIPCL